MHTQYPLNSPQNFFHPCIIDLPGGYRVHGQSKAHLQDALMALKESGIHFPQSPIHTYASSEPPPAPGIPLVPDGEIEPLSTVPDKPLHYHIELYLNKSRRSNVIDSTHSDNCFTLSLLANILNDKPLKRLEPDDIDTFLDALAHLPPRAPSKLGPGMTYRALIEKSKREGMPTIARTTQGKHIKNLRSFVHWAMDSRFITEDPTCMVNIADYTPKQKSKISLTDEDLTKIFDPKFEAKMDTPAKHWIPIIDLYSGMRLNEGAQLYVDDIVQVQGIWCFNISGDRLGQNVKTPSSARYVPIHSKLIELGFLDYVKEVRSQGFDHLFPGQTWGPNGPAGNLSIALNKTHLRDRCGITDKQKSIGCLRHTFSTLASKSGVLTRVITRMMGHSDEKTVLNKHYVDPADVPECKEWIETIVFPALPIRPHVPGRFDKHYLTTHNKAKRGERTKVTDGKRQRMVKCVLPTS